MADMDLPPSSSGSEASDDEEAGKHEDRCCMLRSPASQVSVILLTRIAEMLTVSCMPGRLEDTQVQRAWNLLMGLMGALQLSAVESNGQR